MSSCQTYQVFASHHLIVFLVKREHQRKFLECLLFRDQSEATETAEDNRQTAAWISHDLIRNNELAFSSTTNLQFYRFQILKLFFLYFSLFMCKE